MKEKNIMKSWKYALVAALLPASLWAGTVSGQVRLPGGSPFTGVVGVKVVLTSGTSTDPHVDSATSDSVGNYSMSTTVIHGAHTVLTSKSGYNGSTNLINVPTDTSHVTFNPVVSVNNKTSNFTGVVKRALDSAIVIGATVTLTGGPDPAVNLTKTTDSSGAYRFDSVSTGGTYTVAVSAANYVSTTASGFVVGWNSTAIVPTFYLTQNLGTLDGIVTSNSTGTPAIQGAKVVVSVGNTKVDSTTTNAAGQYTMSLNAATYTVTYSAAGYKDSLGHPTRILTGIVVPFNSPVHVNTTLTPATSQISGTVHRTTATGTGLDSAKVILQRRIGNAGTYITLDSAYTDVSGIFVFSNLIATVGTGFGTTAATAPNYRLVSGKVAGAITWGTSATNGAPVNTVLTAANVPVGGNFVATITLIASPTGILAFGSANEKAIRFSLTGDRLALDLGVSNVARTVSVYGLNGALQHSVYVAAGESHTTVPATFAKGYLFQVK